MSNNWPQKRMELKTLSLCPCCRGLVPRGGEKGERQRKSCKISWDFSQNENWFIAPNNTGVPGWTDCTRHGDSFAN